MWTVTVTSAPVANVFGVCAPERDRQWPAAQGSVVVKVSTGPSTSSLSVFVATACTS